MRKEALAEFNATAQAFLWKMLSVAVTNSDSQLDFTGKQCCKYTLPWMCQVPCDHFTGCHSLTGRNGQTIFIFAMQAFLKVAWTQRSISCRVWKRPTLSYLCKGARGGHRSCEEVKLASPEPRQPLLAHRTKTPGQYWDRFRICCSELYLWFLVPALDELINNGKYAKLLVVRTR